MNRVILQSSISTCGFWYCTFAVCLAGPGRKGGWGFGPWRGADAHRGGSAGCFGGCLLPYQRRDMCLCRSVPCACAWKTPGPSALFWLVLPHLDGDALNLADGAASMRAHEIAKVLFLEHRDAECAHESHVLGGTCKCPSCKSLPGGNERWPSLRPVFVSWSAPGVGPWFGLATPAYPVHREACLWVHDCRTSTTCIWCCGMTMTFWGVCVSLEFLLL